MPSIFQRDDDGLIAEHDPGARLDYAIPTWIEGETFSSVMWSIVGAGSPGPLLEDDQINSVAVTKGGIEYAIGELASVFVSGVAEGDTVVVTCRGTFSGGQVDERSFRLFGVQR